MKIRVDRKELLDGIKYALYSIADKRCAGDKAVKYLSFEIENSLLRIVATDGKKLSIATASILTNVLDGHLFLLIQDDIKKLSELKGREVFISLSEDHNMVTFSTSYNSVTMVNVNLKYPNYRQVIPKFYSHELIIDNVEMLKVLRKVVPRKKDETAHTSISFDGEIALIQYVSSGVTRIGTVPEIPFLYKGNLPMEPCKFWFPAKSLLDISRQHRKDLRLSYNSDKTPVRFNDNRSSYTIAQPARFSII